MIHEETAYNSPILWPAGHFPEVATNIKETQMDYDRPVDRAHPACLVFLVDQSGSMSESMAGGYGGIKADLVCDVVNRVIYEFGKKATKGEEIREYYSVAIIGYGATVGNAFASPQLTGLAKISDVIENSDQTMKKVKQPDGAGGTVEMDTPVKTWISAKAEGSTPMRQALEQAACVIEDWVSENMESFPPIVVNVSDGEPTKEVGGSVFHDDFDEVLKAAQKITMQRTNNGAALLFNCHVARQPGVPLKFPAALPAGADDHAKLMFDMSSILPEKARENAAAQGEVLEDGARGFMFNADYESMVKLLDIGTRLVADPIDAR